MSLYAFINQDIPHQSRCCCLLLLITCLLISIRYTHNHCPPISSAMRSTRMELYKDKQLVGHQIKSITDVRGVIRCALLCAVNSECLSFNYGDTTLECQLNDANEGMFPCHLVTSDQFSYYRVISKDPPEDTVAQCSPVSDNDAPTTTVTSTTYEMDNYPYSCTMPQSGCITFWSQNEVQATLTVEGQDDKNWNLTYIPNGNNIIDNNEPCTDILETKPIEEEYIKYRLAFHHHLDSDGIFGFCYKAFNETGVIGISKCTGKTTLQAIPPMELDLKTDSTSWRIIPSPPDRSFNLEPLLGIDNPTLYDRYVTVLFDGDVINRAWKVCHVL